MLKTVINLTDKQLVRSANVAKALGHPVRLGILKLLAARDTCFCGDITELIPLAQSTVSQHLKALKEVGLIKGEVSGVRTCYCLDPAGMENLKEMIDMLSADVLRPGTEKCC